MAREARVAESVHAWSPSVLRRPSPEHRSQAFFAPVGMPGIMGRASLTCQLRGIAR